MRHKVTMAILTVTAVMVLALYAVPQFIGKQHDEQEVSYNVLIATHVYDVLDKMFGIPIAVSRGMSSNALLKDLLYKEDMLPAEDVELAMSKYLAAIKEEFAFTSAFVVSDKTRRYYTPSGISKIVNPSDEAYDIWYQIFLDSGKDLDLDTDRDQENDYRWTVFVNIRIRDDDGSLLGVCGVGLIIDGLQELFESCEKQYGLKVNLIDDKGLVQVDVDSSNIENAYISDAIEDKADSDTFSYVRKAFGGFRATRYMKDLGWYFVVQGENVRNKNLLLLLPVFLFLLLGILFIMILETPQAILPHTLVKTLQLEDPLTGLPNRNYLNDSYGELGVFNTTRYKSLAMFDIDKFKSINETNDGDEILLKIVSFSKTMVGDRGIIFRWSGDEFVFFLEMEADEAEEKFKKLCTTIREELAVTISVGIVEIDLFESIKKNYHRAVQRCYIVKEAGGDGVCRKL